MRSISKNSNLFEKDAVKINSVSAEELLVRGSLKQNKNFFTHPKRITFFSILTGALIFIFLI